MQPDHDTKTSTPENNAQLALEADFRQRVSAQLSVSGPVELKAHTLEIEEAGKVSKFEVDCYFEDTDTIYVGDMFIRKEDAKANDKRKTGVDLLKLIVLHKHLVTKNHRKEIRSFMVFASFADNAESETLRMLKQSWFRLALNVPNPPIEVFTLAVSEELSTALRAASKTQSVSTKKKSKHAVQRKLTVGGRGR